jgi:hypothetical protein
MISRVRSIAPLFYRRIEFHLEGIQELGNFDVDRAGAIIRSGTS